MSTICDPVSGCKKSKTIGIFTLQSSALIVKKAGEIRYRKSTGQRWLGLHALNLSLIWRRFLTTELIWVHLYGGRVIMGFTDKLWTFEETVISLEHTFSARFPTPNLTLLHTLKFMWRFVWATSCHVTRIHLNAMTTAMDPHGLALSIRIAVLPGAVSGRYGSTSWRYTEAVPMRT